MTSVVERGDAGRLTLAARALKAGTTVFSTRPYAIVAANDQLGSRCSACFKGGVLRQCSRCKVVKYCCRWGVTLIFTLCAKIVMRVWVRVGAQCMPTRGLAGSRGGVRRAGVCAGTVRGLER